MKRINVLQSWRAIFIVMICIEHLSLKNKLAILSAGGEGVSFFFILSGFLIGYVYRNKLLNSSFQDAKTFVFRKLQKFYPLHIIAIILAIIFYSFDTLKSNGADYVALGKIFIKGILNALFLQVYIPFKEWYFNPINGVCWFLSTIIFCYAFSFSGLELIRWAKQKKKTLLLYTTILFIYFFLTQVLNSSDLKGFFLYVFPPVRYMEYLLAMIIGYNYKDNFFITKNRLMSSAIEIIVVFMWLINHLMIKQGVYDVYSNFKYISIHICSVAIVYVFSKEKGIISTLLNNRFLIFLGNISFYIYIMHQVIIRYVCRIVGWNNKGAIASVVCITIYVLMISKYYDAIIEKLKRKKI